MIALDSPEWSRLQHASGLAANIPKLLRETQKDPTPKSRFQAEPWWSLWSALCHQGDVYTASYASVPHLIETAASCDDAIATDFFTLPTAIEIARLQYRGPKIPDDLAGPYFNALERLHDVAFKQRIYPWSDEMAQSVAAALAVSKGNCQLANGSWNWIRIR